MRRTALRLALAALLTGLLSALLPTQAATAAPRPTSVALSSVPPATAAAGETVTLAGKVRGGVPRQKVKLQRRTPAGWQTAATKAIRANLRFRFTWAALVGSHTYRVVAPRTRRTKASTSRTVTVRGVQTTPPSFSVSELPDGYQGVMYRFPGFATRSGWDFSVSAGTLPPGLALTEAPDEGYLDGTPSTPGTYDFTLRITAPGAPAAERAFTIVVHPTGSWATTGHRIAAFSNNGTRAVSGGTAYGTAEEEAAYHNLTSGTVTPIPMPDIQIDGPPPEWTELAPIDLSGNGRYVLLQFTAHYYPDLNYRWLLRWDSLTGNHLQLMDPQYQNPYEASISGDGSIVAWSVNDDLEVWDAASGTSTAVAGLPGSDEWWSVVKSVSDDGRFVLIESDGLWVLDRQSGTFDLVDASGTSPAQLSRDGSTVLYNDYLGGSPERYVLKTWDRVAETIRVVSRLAGGTPVVNDRPYEATISGDGSAVYVSSDQSLGPDDPDDSAPDFERPYFWDERTDRVVPLPMIPGTSSYPDNPESREIDWTEPSGNGAVVGASLYEKYGARGHARWSLAPAWVD